MQLLAIQTACKATGRHRRWLLCSVFGSAMVAWSTPVFAQTATDVYFPTGTSGYDQQLGVTVLSRVRPEYEPLGIKLGSFTVRPNLDQSVFYNSNVNGSSASDSGSWGSETSANVSGQSDWSRDSLAGTVGVDHFQFFDLPSDDYTDWHAGLSAGYTIGDSPLTLSYSHQSYHELGTTIGTVRSDTPELDQTDTAELSYTFNTGRFAITPSFDVSDYRFGDVTLDGAQQSQSFLDRNVLAGGVVTRYALTDTSGLLFVARGVDSLFNNSEAGQPSNDSTSVLFLTGLDFQAESVWRYSLLAGVESRSFAAAQYQTHTAPIVAATVVWSPTGVLTVTGTASRSIEDPESADTNGYVLNQAKLVVDYELMRDVLLQARGGVQYAEYLQAGNQTNETVGGGVTWLVNRNVSLSLNEDYTTQNSADDTTNTDFENGLDQSGAYNQNLVLLRLHVGF